MMNAFGRDKKQQPAYKVVHCGAKIGAIFLSFNKISVLARGVNAKLAQYMPGGNPVRIMRYYIRNIAGLCLLFLFFPFLLRAQTITGIVVESENKTPVKGVKIENIYTNASFVTDTGGLFTISAERGQLLVFTRDGFNAVQVRIPQGTVPPYFKIIISRWWAPQIYEVHDWKYDSTKEHELWKHELEFPKLTGLDVIRSPFSAMDPHNKEIWAFQEMFQENEAEKYIDYMFNKQIVTSLTGLQGDSLMAYMRRYRPDYAQLRAMNQYSFYNYIRKTVDLYRRSGGPSRSRLPH